MQPPNNSSLKVVL